ncbi:MAG TPA: hypothetical protein VGP80_04075 [Gemmatimonadales bacterium]|jgi:hypothetical protein|nr:hypothetical protein [Gemmatimonadales bacterium]
MEDILAIIFLFGGSALVGLSFSPVGRALAERIRGKHAGAVPDAQVYEELDQLRQDVTELQERLDFTERMLAKGREAGQLEP